MKKKLLLIIFAFAVVSLIQISKLTLNDCMKLPNEFFVNYSEIKEANDNHSFGKFVKLSLNEKEIATGTEKQTEQFVVVKLFGFIPIKKVKARLLPEENVFVGGELIGLSVNCSGAVVVSNSTINEDSGEVIKNDAFKNGDIISKINNIEVKELEDIEKALQNSNSEVEIEIIRNNNAVKKVVPLIKDSNGKYKLGIWGRDEFSGVGTLTFVKQDNSFGALGHAITNGNGENVIPIKNGSVYDCNLVGINKGKRNAPGELRCVFIPRNAKGEIYKNTKQGIYGKFYNSNGFIDHNLTASLGGRLSVKPGKAKIVSCVNGLREEYEIEIIKANYQSSLSEKSLVFRVTDERLLELTGGIVQGMSGSPIIQNNKIVGAVTHVFLNDPTKGYGVYTDWMLEQMN